MNRLFAISLVLAAPPALAFDVNGVALGAHEADIKKAFPSAYCKALEWASRAADRRCDDARISFAGVSGRITFYLKSDAVQAFDLRFDSSQRDTMAAQLKSRWGAPASEATETFSRRDGTERRIYKLRWVKGRDQALLTAPLEHTRATLSAARGNFDEEIYRVR